MRLTMMMASVTFLLVASTTRVPAAPTGSGNLVPAVAGVTLAPMVLTASAVQQAQPPAQVKVEVSSTESRTVWYMQPMWLAIGGLALLVVILMIVMAARGGRNNTTVVK